MVKQKHVEPEIRDEVVDFVHSAHKLTGLSIASILVLLGLSSNRFYDWQDRKGKPNKHNGHIPKDTWLTPVEKKAILEYHSRHPLNGYRRLCYMMTDEDIVYCSPNSVYRTLKDAGVLDNQPPKGGSKGEGFCQPIRINQHWHVDVSYLNICGTFYYLCSVLDGYSRYIVHQEIRESMKEAEIEIIIQRALEKTREQMLANGYSQEQSATLLKPRIISDQGPQFIAKDFKLFVKLSGMTHVRTSPYYPQSNGKIERWHRELKTTYRSKDVSSIAEARDVVSNFVDEYNHLRLHSALGYTTPYDRYLGLDNELKEIRQEKLKAAAARRVNYWQGIETAQRVVMSESFLDAPSLEEDAC